MKILGPDFFAQKTLKAARDLVGCFLMRKIDGKIRRFKIIETEAYVGPHDLASHSSKGRTARTEIMFDEPGTIYIYMIYGMYFMLNVVTEKKDHPSAILIRGVREVEYISDESYNGPGNVCAVYNGPGKLTKALKIDKSLNGKKAIPKNGLWFEAGEHLSFIASKIDLKSDSKKLAKQSAKKSLKIKRSKRVGVEYAGPIWAEKEYRFILEE